MAGGVWYPARMGRLDRQSGAGADRVPVRHAAAAHPGKPDFRRLEEAPGDAEEGRRLLEPLQPDRLLFVGGQQRLHRGAAGRAPTIRSPIRSIRSASMTGRWPIGARGRLVYRDRRRQAARRRMGPPGLHRSPAHAGIDADLRQPREGRRDPRATRSIAWAACRPAPSRTGRRTRPGTTGHKADPRSFCIQKTLQEISHSDKIEDQLMFAGHNAYRFADDPVLLERLHADGEATGRAPGDRRLR